MLLFLFSSRSSGAESEEELGQNFRNLLEFAPLREFDLSHQLSRLRQGRQLSTSEATLIVQTLAQSVKSDSEITAVRQSLSTSSHLLLTLVWINGRQLLAHLPSHFGGLLPLAFGLFHPSPVVRNATLELFDQIGSHPVRLSSFYSLLFRTDVLVRD